jgi:hypothetical protein
MTTTELSTEQEEMWRTFFDENHADLVIVAEMLLRCHLSPERILRKALSGLESSPCEVTFGLAIHAVIDAAIEYNRETANSPLQAKTSPPVKLRVPGISQITTFRGRNGQCIFCAEFFIIRARRQVFSLI